MNTPAALDIAARTLHDFTLAHLHIQDGVPPLEDGRYKPWDEATESARRSRVWLAQKALDLATFDEFYQWTTLAERQMGHEVPDASSDTERTRGARAQYYLVQHLLRIDEAGTAPCAGEVQA
ncbi:hypothetical protein [Streptomyces sp. NPDC093589]|uniref:hypothetical protein n=1 Tax=Streptomyces sp. NPDC093589 TaxID=3366043 RepID=UPI0038033704